MTQIMKMISLMIQAINEQDILMHSFFRLLFFYLVRIIGEIDPHQYIPVYCVESWYIYMNVSCLHYFVKRN